MTHPIMPFDVPARYADFLEDACRAMRDTCLLDQYRLDVGRPRTPAMEILDDPDALGTLTVTITVERKA